MHPFTQSHCRKVLLDVGAHFGESLLAAKVDKWGFDHIYCFEPTSAGVQPLIELSKDDPRISILPYGLWNRSESKDIYSPGSLAASVDQIWATRDKGFTTSETCDFVRASDWFKSNLNDSDSIWMKVNIEGSEIEVLTDLLDSGEIRKVDHLVVHLDAARVGRHQETRQLIDRLAKSCVNWLPAFTVMYGW